MTGVDPADFRRAAGQFASGIVVVTTSDGHAMTVSAFTSVSLEPPLVLFCAEKIARFHDAVIAAGEWAVSILSADAEKTARWLATRGRPMAGQLDGITNHPGIVTGAPLVSGALAALECRTTAVHDAGDHSIVVGQVEYVTTPAGTGPPAGAGSAGTGLPAGVGSAGTPVPATATASAAAAASGPLVHYAGAYHRLADPPH
jgi:flavin reductase (DIM6/NTAB) family NADH-FMN oxidoreductase RutF